MGKRIKIKRQERYRKECLICGTKIYHKAYNAKYCFVCSSIRETITEKIAPVAFALRQRFKGYNIKFKFELEKVD